MAAINLFRGITESVDSSAVNCLGVATNNSNNYCLWSSPAPTPASHARATVLPSSVVCKTKSYYYYNYYRPEGSSEAPRWKTRVGGWVEFNKKCKLPKDTNTEWRIVFEYTLQLFGNPNKTNSASLMNKTSKMLTVAQAMYTRRPFNVLNDWDKFHII